MTKQELLLQRLNEIANALESSGKALALLGLGSAGSEMERMDAYSDLDFFVIVRDQNKATFLENLEWLSHIEPIAYAFMNTVDGFKVLYADEIFLEFAVFETAELKGIPFASEKIIWQDDAFDASILQPTQQETKPLDVQWALGEALTNLYVGMMRYRRGEKMSAFRFVQGYALDRVLDLASLVETEQPATKDKFSNERRFEQRFPETAVLLPQLMQGYDKTPQSAEAILQFLDTHFAINQAIKHAIYKLIYEITIEVGSQADCAKVLIILQTAFAPYADTLQPPSGVVRETEQTLQEKLATNTLLLAKNGDKIVGCVFYMPQPDQPQTIYLGRLAVLPAYQKQGIARKLLAQVEQDAQQDGYKKGALYVRKALPTNVQFFQSCGYEIYDEGTHQGFSEPTFYKMAKII